MNIRYIPAHTSNYSNRQKNNIEYIVIHYTANDGDTAENNCRYFQGANRGASAHYFVDENEVCSSVQDKNKAWHSGSENGTYKHKYARNENAIGIEMCSRKSNGTFYFKDGTVKNTVELVKQLMKWYNIPIGNILRHYDITGKECPKPYVNEVKWSEFKEMLKEPMKEHTVLETTKININGKTREVQRVLINGNNFIKLRDLESDKIKIGYDKYIKLPIIETL